MLVIPANTSATAFYQQLSDNGGGGVMFETEADTLAKAMKQDWGDFSDGLRKAFHHETISYSRRKDNERVYIDSPRLAVLMTCTPGQVPILLGNNEVENGTANRYLFYCLRGGIKWENPFATEGPPLSDTLESIGKKFLELWHELQEYKDSPIEFTLSEEQKERFSSYFTKLLPEQVGLAGNKEFTAFVFRLGVTAFRIAMVLTVLRRYDCTPHFEEESNVLVCNDKDFQTALTIVDCLVGHTSFVYSNLLSQDNKQENASQSKMNNTERTYYNHLPKTFTTKEAQGAAKELGIPLKSAERYLGNMVSKHRVIRRIKQGQYEKS